MSYTLLGKRCSLGAARVLLKLCRRRFRRRISEFQRLCIVVSRELTCFCQTQIGVFGGFFGHRDSARSQCFDGRAAGVRGRNIGLALANHDTQANIDPFGALRLFQLPLTHIDFHRSAVHRHRVGAVCARALGGLEQLLGEGL